MPLNGAKQRAKNAQATKKRKAEEQAASISVIEAEIEAAASSQQLVADGARLHSPTLACSVCADALAGLTAADVLSGCMTCNSCGTRVPPRTVADATAIVRHATSLAPIDCAVPRRRSAAAKCHTLDGWGNPKPTLVIALPSIAGKANAAHYVRASVSPGLGLGTTRHRSKHCPCCSS